ncbi:hypothetical protein CSPAE12_02357 [Colletotrichum incanum]|nr:hypothetical protein CSPAE12_02357 [Colletotrichum incanum]
MSPPPPEKGKHPVTGDAASSDEDSQRRDGSSHTLDVETADAHVGTGEAREEEESLDTTQTQPTPNRPGTRSRLSRFLGRPSSGRQDDNTNDMSLKKKPASAVPSQDDRHHRVQFPSMDLDPAVAETHSAMQLSMNRKTMKKIGSKRRLRNDEITDATSAIAPGPLSNAEAERKYRRSEPSVSKDLGLGAFAPQFLSEMSVEIKAEEMSEPFDQPGKPSPSLMKASRLTITNPKNGKDLDSSSSGAENEKFREVYGPSKKAQRVMVDRVMSSFMNWLDTKLKIKKEDESPEREPPPLGVPPLNSSSRVDPRYFFTPVPVSGNEPCSTVSGIESMLDAPRPSRQICVAFKSARPPPPPAPAPPSSLPAPGAPSRSLGKKRGVVTDSRLFGSQPPDPNALMAAPSSSFSASPANLQLGAPPGRSSAFHVVAAAAPPPKKRNARSSQGAQAGIVSAGSRAKRPNKHDRSTDGNIEEEEGNSDGDGNRPPRAKLSKVHEDRVNGAKLACPFFKHNPRKYKTQRPCCGPGWDHVHRIKEHIYRKHSLPKFSCPRCSQPFETQTDLQAHARSADACEVREPEVLDGLTQDQEKRLRSRKKTSTKELTEAEKWTQMYSIIFPDVREREIPSPYYNTEDADTSLGGYEDYLRRQLPPLVRRQLEKEVDREFSFVEEGLKQKVIDIARNLQLTLFKGYQQLENQERGVQHPPSFDASDSRTDGSTFSAPDTSPSTMTTGGTTPEFPDPLEIFSDHVFPDLDFNLLSEVSYTEQPQQQQLKDPSFAFEFMQPFNTQQPDTIQPGMELVDGQQFYYGLDGYQDSQGYMRDSESLGYVP